MSCIDTDEISMIAEFLQKHDHKSASAKIDEVWQLWKNLDKKHISTLLEGRALGISAIALGSEFSKIAKYDDAMHELLLAKEIFRILVENASHIDTPMLGAEKYAKQIDALIKQLPSPKLVMFSLSRRLNERECEKLKSLGEWCMVITNDEEEIAVWCRGRDRPTRVREMLHLEFGIEHSFRLIPTGF